ncbi:hypothetical protein RHSIM_Rhsim06G0121000 [Rhododendron simsii]|uniref:Uncharacterized protein n=1 Tax=Rhododendron simsii TaxID=118357 RepID=A0A834GT30_RHOSS|nr:hypothetical protein RHSIM_Rhsim06G0121000 [Rhododendron simsii]
MPLCSYVDLVTMVRRLFIAIKCFLANLFTTSVILSSQIKKVNQLLANHPVSGAFIDISVILVHIAFGLNRIADKTVIFFVFMVMSSCYVMLLIWAGHNAIYGAGRVR